MPPENSAGQSPARNYQLDFLKLIFTFFVFLGHAGTFFANPGTRIPFDISWTSLGYVSVHSFFVISGLLMINSLSKLKTQPDKAGETALNFVVRKYKAIALPYIVVLIINIFVYFNVNGSAAGLKKLPHLLPEIFCLSQSGTNIAMINGHTWYISAMLVALLPLAYLYLRNNDLYINILAPFGGLLLLGFMLSSEYTNSRHYLSQYEYCGFILGGVLRAACGILLSGVAWIICKKLIAGVKTKESRILLTIIEAVLYLLFFGIWFYADRDTKYSYIAMMIIPIIIAIVFSQKSYFSEIFQNRIFRFCGSLSLAVYLNQWCAEILIMEYFPGKSFKMSLLLMAGITAASCCIYYAAIHLLRLLWNKKLKKLFADKLTENDN
ncbi:MAG: acyltransferase family protein [Huintestinicola sp.]|uniref:acyltransferase family protein n=1 Tax=Huintestinicola sp. TaxID=2981661 RepID=UPI003F02D45D